MAFALPRISKRKPKLKPRSRPSYSPKTEQEITQSMFNLALAGPRWIGEQMGKDLDEAFEIGTTGVSVTQFIRHPLKTIKKTARKWTISKWKNEIEAQLVAEYVWKPRLVGMMELERERREGLEGTMRQETDPARWRQLREELRQLPSTSSESEKAIFDWVSKPQGYGRDIAFEKLEELCGQGEIAGDVWQGIQRQHQWDELSRFRRKPGRYLWQKATGKRGKKGKGPLYRFTPQKLVGEKTKKRLAKTGVGKAVGGIKRGAGRVAQRVVGTAKEALKKAAKFAGRQVVKGTKWVVTKVAGQATWTAISAAVGGAVGTVGGPVGTVIGFLAGPAISKLFEWFIKIACLGCGCAAAGFVAFIAFVVIVVGGAFRPPADRGPGTEQLVGVVKTVSPSRVDLVPASQPNPIVEYTINFENLTEEEVSGARLVDDYDEENFTPFSLGYGNMVDGTLVWDLGNLAANASGSVTYDGFVKANDGVDKIVTNVATFTGTIEGEEVSDTAMASVIVGNPSGQPPSGWPVDHGCISQGFNVTSDPTASHYGKDMIDVTGVTNQPIYATHDGKAYVYYGDSIYGNYVIVVSANFKTRYAHLLPAIKVSSGDDVVPGQLLGGMGNTGRSTATHVHYDVKDMTTGTLVTSQYIPDNSFDGCVGRVTVGGNCDCCFTSRNARCGE